MCHKPDRHEGREKLDQWARERQERGEERPNQPALNTSPREHRAADDHDLDRSVERFEALLGR
jgi:hypothetical protein